MVKILIALAASLAAFLLVVGIALYLLKRKLKSALADVAKSLGSLAATPARITLVRVEGQEARWRKAPEVEGASRELLDAGFEPAGDFHITEIPALTLRAFTKADEQLWACVYDHEQAGVWCDVVVRFESGGSLTASSSPHTGVLDQRPGHRKVREEGAGPGKVLEAARRERGPETALPAVAAEFKDVIEKAYADEMDWRNARGGATEDEIRRVASRMDGDYGDAAIAATRSALSENAKAALETSIRERFLETSSFPAARWEKLRDRVVIVHERMDADEVVSIASENTELPAEIEDVDAWLEEEAESSPDPRDLFAKLNGKLAPRERFEKLGSVSDPVKADLWLVPER